MPAAAKAPFLERTKPNLLEYDGVGFDADCLIDYRKDNFCRLVTEQFLLALTRLCPANYPEKIAAFDINTVFGQDGLLGDISNLGRQTTLWDLKTGLLIRLDEFETVVWAAKGLEKLTEGQI